MNNSRCAAERPDADRPDTVRIRALNNAFRRTFTGGRVVMTADAADPAVTVRVLTLMLAEEY